MKEAEVKELMAMCYKRGLHDGLGCTYGSSIPDFTEDTVDEVYMLHMMEKQEQEVEE